MGLPVPLRLVRQVPPPRREVASEAVTGRHVRFAPESGHVRCNSACPLCANTGHQRYAFGRDVVAPSTKMGGFARWSHCRALLFNS